MICQAMADLMISTDNAIVYNHEQILQGTPQQQIEWEQYEANITQTASMTGRDPEVIEDMNILYGDADNGR